MFSHSENCVGDRHGLVEHLREVSLLAETFARKFGAPELGRWAGIWHDLGKCHRDFQLYLVEPDRERGPDHKGAGAVLAMRYSEPLAFVINGHHGGLPDRDDLRDWLRERGKAPQVREALERAKEIPIAIEPKNPLNLPSYLQTERLDTEFFLRMLFSALTDADFLDTERHFNPEKAEKRGVTASLTELLKLFEVNQEELTGKRMDQVNRIRHEVYELCVRAAERPPGFFRLAVPTGGGKTRSSMAFALRHAFEYGLDRVIVAIPYTSIIEQTAEEYRKIFGEKALLEHHSGLMPKEDGENPSKTELWVRLASENWDAPIVVTTTVQLFESLLGNRTSQCRKLHNIAKSVLILDEVQTLPAGLLDPILDVLRQLVTHYGVSVVLSTATQPALENSPYLKGLDDVRDIIPNPSLYYAQLKRVRYQWSKEGETMTWAEVAAEVRKEEQALVIVNTKNDAMALLDVLDDPNALHLSTLMCGAHRHNTIKEIKRRLEERAPCRLVSTQVVEAGVDLDFPLVLRAIAPLDRIVQAAGRCNREGRMSCGRVVVFTPEEGKLPPGDYKTGTYTAASLLRCPDFDFDNPQVYATYFNRLYQVVETDKGKIQEIRQSMKYQEVAIRFRMIDDDTLPLVVRYRGPDGSDNTVERLLEDIQNGRNDMPRWEVLRRLQAYMVNVRRHRLEEYEKEGLVSELAPGLWEWLGRYDRVRGLTPENRDPDALVV